MGSGRGVSELDEFKAIAVEMIGEFGTTATLVVPNRGAVDDAGNVEEDDPTEHVVQCSDLVDESRRYGSLSTHQQIAGTVYLTAEVPVEPSLAHRLIYQGRTFQVLAAFPYRVQGGIAAWRLDLSEVAGG